jgi:hypothetical protein
VSPSIAIGAPGSTSTSCAAIEGTAAAGGGSTFVIDRGGTIATRVLSADVPGAAGGIGLPLPAPGAPGVTV